MGKGDKKTKRGKIIIGSYGVTRKRKDPSAKRTGTKTIAVSAAVEPDAAIVSADEAMDKAAKKKAAAKAPKTAEETAAAEE
jgi:30S ribosomal protein S31